MKQPDTICSIDFGSPALTTRPFTRTCRYHKKQGQIFSGSDLLPHGLCPHAYNAAYAHCLALLYGGSYEADENHPVYETMIACPSSHNTVLMKISMSFTLPYLLRKLKNILVRLFLLLGIPAEYPDKKVIIETADVQGSCPRGQTPGKRFLFNIWNRNELCPASFYAAHPLLMAKILTARTDAPSKTALFHCPDPRGVSYAGTAFDMRCELFFDPADTNPSTMCPLARYAVFPYYHTLMHGGRFEWLKKNEPVSVQCPHPEGVIMHASISGNKKPGAGTVRVSIKNIIKNCPKGHTPGMFFEFNTENPCVQPDIYRQVNCTGG